jgi:hypothetical protein
MMMVIESLKMMSKMLTMTMMLMKMIEMALVM